MTANLHRVVASRAQGFAVLPILSAAFVLLAPSAGRFSTMLNAFLFDILSSEQSGVPQ